ncbi:phosphopantothenoylcysteine decarboxylase [Bacteroidia bacterium]|nr:phosphopantothenoylcysteine decarboxylase [Bacteroidia bacterium]
MLQGQKILLGITGGIAAYKSAVLLRLLVKQGASVRVVMTPAAKQFMAPLTMATLSKNIVPTEFFNPENGEWNSHIALGEWADWLVIAPATANTLAKMANGIADNLLLTTYLSARCETLVAPAMDGEMYAHAATQRNLATLAQDGVHFVAPAVGELASGLEGIGRMAEPDEILQNIVQWVQKKKLWSHKKILITAGPTFENIDSVRFIGNSSSGKMAYALAEELAHRGAQVQLVSGPVSLQPHHTNITLHKVRSAKEMLAACTEKFPTCDVAILVAAVADYTPTQTCSTKIKREKADWQLTLTPTEDIAATLGKLKAKQQLLVGFALEDQNEIANAQQKLQTKNLDMIVLNSLNDKGAGFEQATNKITIIDKHGNITPYPLKSKTAVAGDIADKLLQMMEG